MPDERGRNFWSTLTADLLRYTGEGPRPWSLPFMLAVLRAAYGSPALLAVVVYRYGQWLKFQCRVPVLKQLLKLGYFFVYNLSRFSLQVEIDLCSRIGPGLVLFHFCGTFIHDGFVAGRNLTVGQGVLIGCDNQGLAAHVGNDVVLNGGVKLIGGLVLGDRVVAGAGAVVLHSFGDDAVIGGVPAKLLNTAAPRAA
jgi:serine O-acetyltransferase